MTVETAIAIAIGIVILALLPIAPRLFWRGVCPPDCRHAWRAVRRTSERVDYSCSLCGDTLARIDGTWPPECSKSRFDCRWPYCIPLREIGVVRMWVGSVRRLMWRMVDAPE